MTTLDVTFTTTLISVGESEKYASKACCGVINSGMETRAIRNSWDTHIGSRS